MRFMLIAAVLLSCSWALADDADKSAQTQIEYWRAKLKDQDPKVRQQASDALRKLGEGKDAAIDPTSESVEVLPPPQPDAGFRGGRFAPGPLERGPNAHVPRFGAGAGAGAAAGITRFGNGAKVFTRSFVASENGRTVRIQEDNDGITVTTTKEADGQIHTRVSKAKDLESLKKDHPEAFEVYEKYAGRMQMHLRPPMIKFGDVFNADELDLDLPMQDREQIENMLTEARKMRASHQHLFDRHRKMIEEHRKLADRMRDDALAEIERVRRELRER